jgi:hypothetical protein
MGLQVENIAASKDRRPVAEYVRARTDRDWDAWLQTNRIELNAMTTPQFIEWLDGKMAGYDGKLIPPTDVLEAELAERIDTKVRTAVTARILREAAFEDQVTIAIEAIKSPTGDELAEGIADLFSKELDREWRDHIGAVADDVA